MSEAADKGEKQSKEVLARKERELEVTARMEMEKLARDQKVGFRV